MKNHYRIVKVLLFLALAFIACEMPQQYTFMSKGQVNYPLSPGEELMLDSIQQKTFRYFLNEHHKDWGIVKDRTAVWAPASIASTGFGIPCFAIGAERKWITRQEAAQITLNILNFFMNSAQGDGKDMSGYKGFYYHFLKMDTGNANGTANFPPWIQAC
jgi:hypothetical protein